jgi:hypothetical protein
VKLKAMVSDESAKYFSIKTMQWEWMNAKIIMLTKAEADLVTSCRMGMAKALLTADTWKQS